MYFAMSWVPQETILMSTTGEPSRASSPLTSSLFSSTFTSFTVVEPMGFGRMGLRSAKTPRFGLHVSPCG